MSDSNIKKEVLIEDQPIPVPIQGIKKILFQLENCICQIYQRKGGKGTGGTSFRRESQYHVSGSQSGHEPKIPFNRIPGSDR